MVNHGYCSSISLLVYPHHTELEVLFAELPPELLVPTQFHDHDQPDSVDYQAQSQARD